MDIAALSETRREEEGWLSENGVGYTFFWHDKPAGEPRQAGVGFAFCNKLLPRLENLPKAESERIITLRVPLKDSRYAKLVSVFAPTMTNDEVTKELYYQQLHEVITAIPKADKLILLGDFNARVGSDAPAWRKVIGKHGSGKANSNGLLLLSCCEEHQLVISNTTFKQSTSHSTSWQHPRSKDWHLIDFSALWREYFNDLLNCPSFVDDTTIEEIEQLPIVHALSEPTNHAEVTYATKFLSNGKAPGEDGIQPEIYKAGGAALMTDLLQLFTRIWDTEQVPQDLQDAPIIAIYKRKGDKSDCSNYRGISLL